MYKKEKIIMKSKKILRNEAKRAKEKEYKIRLHNLKNQLINKNNKKRINKETN